MTAYINGFLVLLEEMCFEYQVICFSYYINIFNILLFKYQTDTETLLTEMKTEVHLITLL
jgi:hypothetical protein